MFVCRLCLVVSAGGRSGAALTPQSIFGPVGFRNQLPDLIAEGGHFHVVGRRRTGERQRIPAAVTAERAASGFHRGAGPLGRGDHFGLGAIRMIGRRVAVDAQHGLVIADLIHSRVRVQPLEAGIEAGIALDAGGKGGRDRQAGKEEGKSKLFQNGKPVCAQFRDGLRGDARFTGQNNKCGGWSKSARGRWRSCYCMPAERPDKKAPRCRL